MSADIPPAIGDFPPGARIAGYRIEQLIGRGGMAVVYRATDVRLDRMVALKILSPDLARNDSFRQRFIRESRAGAAVDHPHVIPVFEAGEAEDVLFIAMRYVSGLDVRALIERLGLLPAERTVELITQVASALDTAHLAGLVHRDVKPANMLLASQNDDGLGSDHVYLSDFGLSKQSVSSPSLTMTGQFLGTLDYMSPEQVNGRQIDGKTDQYALGCAAFEMLTGQPPFRREANMAVMWAQVSAPPPSVRTARPDLSSRVDDVLGRALAKAPEERFATCMDFALALREACAVKAGAPGVVPPPREPTELVPGVGVGGGLAGVGGGIEPTVSRGVPDNGGYSGRGVGYATPTPTPPAPTGPIPAAQGGQGGPGGPGGQQYWQGSAGGPPGYGGSGYGGPPSGPGGAGPTAGGVGPDGTQYGPWVAQQYPGSGGGFLVTDPVQPPRRGKGPLVLLGVLIVLVLVGSAVLVLHLRGASNKAGPQVTHTVTVGPTGTPNNRSSSPITTPSQSPTHQTTGPLGPAATVQAFYQAVNAHQYRKAWNLNSAAHNISDYQQFKDGFADTSHDTVTITGVSGDTVSITLVADQTDGSTKTFSGSYVVQNGIIVQSSIQQTS
ncbi:MAG TPA: serine/threonine-protein kinase [Streptosporangiaceae bacterium]|nr:serine/threonine-protein kinase [Streptosporangiaceae bacterium]